MEYIEIVDSLYREVYKLPMSVEQDQLKRISRRKFFRRVGNGLMVSGLSVAVGGVFAGNLYQEHLTDEAEKEAKISYPPPSSKELRDANLTISQVDEGKRPPNGTELERAYIIKGRQKTYEGEVDRNKHGFKGAVSIITGTAGLVAGAAIGFKGVDIKTKNYESQIPKS